MGGDARGIVPSQLRTTAFFLEKTVVEQKGGVGVTIYTDNTGGPVDSVTGQPLGTPVSPDFTGGKSLVTGTGGTDGSSSLSSSRRSSWASQD